MLHDPDHVPIGSNVWTGTCATSAFPKIRAQKFSKVMTLITTISGVIILSSVW